MSSHAYSDKERNAFENTIFSSIGLKVPFYTIPFCFNVVSKTELKSPQQTEINTRMTPPLFAAVLRDQTFLKVVAPHFFFFGAQYENSTYYL
jgi:hypothetical protein